MTRTLAAILKQLNRRPLIVGSIANGERLADLARIAFLSGADLIELRIDAFDGAQRARLVPLLKDLRKSTPLSLIATVRAASEQDPSLPTHPLDDEERRRLYLQALPYVDWIDVELDADRINSVLLRRAHALGKKAILSCHDFRSVPREPRMRALAAKCRKLGGDIFKLAAAAQNKAEATRLMRLCLSLKGMNRVFIAAGRAGTLSRVTNFRYGSCFTYGYVEEKTASGQLSVKELVKYCQLYYPQYALAFRKRTKR